MPSAREDSSLSLDQIALAKSGRAVSRPVSRLLERLLAGYKGGVTLVGVAAGVPSGPCIRTWPGGASFDSGEALAVFLFVWGLKLAPTVL